MSTEPQSESGSAVGFTELILGMRAAYARGENAMEFARTIMGAGPNLSVATLIAYDLQAGSYVTDVRAEFAENERWCKQLAEVLKPMLTAHSSVLEVGAGEATTLAGVIRQLPQAPRYTLGFDISWSRCAAGLAWLAEQEVSGMLFVADLFNIPLEDASVDVVYTSHSIEPNGGRETDAIRELMRIARRAVVLVEPIYEFASSEAQERMRRHGYVRGLKETAERLGAKVVEYRLLDYARNPLNPSGLLVIAKQDGDVRTVDVPHDVRWRCPLTHTPMKDVGDVYVGRAGIVYPVLRHIPLLRSEHAIIASSITG